MASARWTRVGGNGRGRYARRWLPAVGGVALAGGALVYAGVTGRISVPEWLQARLPARGERGLVVERAVTVLRPRDELYRFWRSFENLPRFMPYLQSVTTGADGRSRWVTSGPAGTTVAWEAEIVEERPDELIRWRSLPDAQVSTQGEVCFEPAPGGRGTEVRVRFEYDPPAGLLGATIAQIVGQGADRQVRESIRRFKSLMEAGEIPTTDGQPRGGCR